MSRRALKPEEVHAIVCALHVAAVQYGQDAANVRVEHEKDARAMVQQVAEAHTEEWVEDNLRRVEAGEFTPDGVRRTIEQLQRQRETAERLAGEIEEKRLQIVMGED